MWLDLVWAVELFVSIDLGMGWVRAESSSSMTDLAAVEPVTSLSRQSEKHEIC